MTKFCTSCQCTRDTEGGSMTDRELLQQALDMLDDINQCSLPPTGIPLPAEIDHVMEALRSRLERPEPEPVAWMHKSAMGHVYFRKNPQDAVFNPQPLYTEPPKKEWVGLTREDWDPSKREFYFSLGVYWAEAKLKEKNS